MLNNNNNIIALLHNEKSIFDEMSLDLVSLLNTKLQSYLSFTSKVYNDDSYVELYMTAIISFMMVALTTIEISSKGIHGGKNIYPYKFQLAKVIAVLNILNPDAVKDTPIFYKVAIHELMRCRSAYHKQNAR